MYYNQIDTNALGRCILSIRRRNHMTRLVFAQAINSHIESLKAYENGQTVPKEKELKKIIQFSDTPQHSVRDFLRINKLYKNDHSNYYSLRLSSHILNVKKLAEKQDKLGLLKYIKLLTDQVNYDFALDTIDSSLITNEQFENRIFPSVAIKQMVKRLEEAINGKSFLNHYYLDTRTDDVCDERCYHLLPIEPITYDLASFPTLISAWNNTKIIESLTHISSKNVLSVNSNVDSSYYYPMPLVTSISENHSQLSALLMGKGKSAIGHIIDIRPLLDQVTFDGIQFLLTNKNKVIFKSETRLGQYFGTIFEITKTLQPYSPDISSNIFKEDINQLLKK